MLTDRLGPYDLDTIIKWKRFRMIDDALARQRQGKFLLDSLP